MVSVSNPNKLLVGDVIGGPVWLVCLTTINSWLLMYLEAQAPVMSPY